MERLHRDCEVLVVGRGFAGLATASELVSLGASVCVVGDRNVVSASSRCGGIVAKGPPMEVSVFARRYGEAAAFELLNLCRQNETRMKNKFPNDFKVVSKINFFCFGTSSDEIYEQIVSQRIMERCGIPCSWLARNECSELIGAPLSRRVLGGTVTRDDCVIDVGMVISSLETILSKSGRCDLTYGRVEDIRCNQDYCDVFVQTGFYRAQSVVLATNKLPGFLSFPSWSLIEFRYRYEIAPAPPSVRFAWALNSEARFGLVSGGTSVTGCPVDSADDPVVLLPRGHTATPTIGRGSGAQGMGANVVTPTWETSDGMPVIGRMPGQPKIWVNCLYGGHALSSVFEYSKRLATVVLGGENLLPAWVSPSRSIVEPAY